MPLVLLLLRPQYAHHKICCSQMLEFNVPGGKLNRGMAVLDVLKAIKGIEVLDGTGDSQDVSKT